MNRREKLGNVVKLCHSFVRNLAYYRAGWANEHRHLLEMTNTVSGDFWRKVNGNFIDMCVLDWCKLFGEKTGEYFWKNIVADAARFNADLLFHLGLEEQEFNRQIHIMREYRDKWVAHLDLERSGFFPALEVPKKAAWFYYGRIVQQEPDLSGLPAELDGGYEHCEEVAKAIYQRSG